MSAEGSKNDSQTITEVSSPKDSRWVIENAHVLLDFASVKFKKYGRGAVLLQNDILTPPKYVSSEEANMLGLSDLVPFIERYDPTGGFIISLETDGESKKRHTYRVDIQKIISLEERQ